ncbi:MAG: hypothetical protein LBV45_04485 [Xanthomonadaceae bacterium]|nr:hypothetical protein [Xanthomonadaceae bacterium]
MRNPWWQFLLLRGSLQALPPSMSIAFGLWFATLVLQIVIEIISPLPARFGYLDVLIKAVVEVVLTWSVLRMFRRGEVFAQLWQASSLGNVVRLIAFSPLAWFLAKKSSLPPGEGMALAVAVLSIAFLPLLWMIPYYIRMWKQGLDTQSNGLASAIMLGMALAAILFDWLFLTPDDPGMPFP